MRKEFIQNRKNQKIAVIVEPSSQHKGLVFVMHGLGGFKEQPQIEAFTEVFSKKGYTVVRFDTTNTLGESDGKYENATVTNYYEDLEDVISWAKSQKWYQEPFILVGHSLGGLCVALYAQKYPKKVKALAPISAVISGKLSIEAHPKEEIEKWQKTGWRVSISKSRPGVIKRLPWSHMEDRLKYDLLKDADKLKMPVLLIVGDNDKVTPVEHQRLFYEKLPGPKELHIIEGAEHTFRETKHLKEIQQIISHWITSIDGLVT